MFDYNCYMANDIGTEISFNDNEHNGIYHNGLDIVAENGSYFISPEIIWDDIAQPHLVPSYEDYVFGHNIKLKFSDFEEAEGFYHWISDLAEYEEHVPAYPGQSDLGRRLSQISAESVFLYIPGVGDICSAIIEEAMLHENDITLSLFLSIKGSGYDEIESILPILFG